MQSNTTHQPWLSKPWVDTIFILLPPFASLLFIVAFPSLFEDQKGISTVWWIILILLIDVAHVYSTLYRTYFDKDAWQKQRTVLLAVPFAGFVTAVLLYSFDDMLFWRLLAYVAVFHFVRQQYGFMRIYSRKENAGATSRFIDKIAIYYSTLYPLLYWHLSGPRNFNWFIEGDFIVTDAPLLLNIFTIAYWGTIILYIVKEAAFIVSRRTVNVPRNAVIIGTALSWYFGIVYFNGDMAFTLLNVVSHGIPYMALVWIYGHKNYTQRSKGGNFLRLLFSEYGLPLFIGLLFLFAFAEESLWDMTLWKEHGNIFRFPQLQLNNDLLKILVPLLALPQITHYILDGFIWKIRSEEFKWSGNISEKQGPTHYRDADLRL